MPNPRRAVPPEILRIIVTAIRHRQAMAVRYQSMTSATPAERWIEPHARSWYRRDSAFKVFVLGRILCVMDQARA